MTISENLAGALRHMGSLATNGSFTSCTPDTPGPPGLKNNVPIRSPARLARCRITASVIFAPPGRAQSNGTGTRAQSSRTPQLLQRIDDAKPARSNPDLTGRATTGLTTTAANPKANNATTNRSIAGREHRAPTNAIKRATRVASTIVRRHLRSSSPIAHALQETIPGPSLPGHYRSNHTHRPPPRATCDSVGRSRANADGLERGRHS